MVGTLRILAGVEGLTVAVLCGRSERLAARVRREAGHAIGWLEDISVALSVADLLVDNAGGMTYQEATFSGLPTVLYQPLPDHGIRNAGEDLDESRGMPGQ